MSITANLVFWRAKKKTNFFPIECNKVADIAVALAVFAAPRDGPAAVRLPLRVALPAAAGREVGQRRAARGAHGVQTR